MEQNRLKELLQEITTPAYIFDFDEFEKRAMLVKRYFTDSVGMCFSIKANPFLLKYLPSCFDHIEVCSPGELTVCEKTHMDMNKVIFSGVNKTYEDVKRAMDDQVGVFTAESMLHVRMINDEAVKRGIKVPLLPRLTAGSQFGMSEEEIIDIINNRDSYAGFDIVGLHFFSGTQKRKVKIIAKELDYIDDFCTRVKEQTGFSFDRIEYGTGLAVDYFSDDADATEEERLKEVSEVLVDFSKKYRITVEMGRFFAATCGYYLTKVMDIKTNKGVNYAIVDGGLNQLKYDGQLQGMQIPQILHFADHSLDAEKEKWTLCGSLCTTADVIARDALFCDLSIGDVLVFCRTGAYSVSEGMALFLSRELPMVALYSASRGLQIVREIIKADTFNTP
ncbi:MAG: diaminopimelate decarboxylase [Ruminococcus sp.]|nr:diaminopimelate decarboxylase [Ruminococcus sp.]